MGLFGKRRPAIEQQLIDTYARVLRPRFDSDREARKVAEEWLDHARAQAKAEGTLDLVDAADAYLADAAADPEKRARLEAKRADGVTDEDIRWWWNLPDLVRRMLLTDDNHIRIAHIVSLQEQGQTMEQAVADLRRNMPLWGDPTDTSDTTADDRMLPFELKHRVNRWSETKFANPEEFSQQLAEATSCNALIRTELRAGRV